MMHRQEIERSVAGLDEHLRDALLLSTECTHAESAKRLGITMDQLVDNVDEAKRKIVAELLGDWQDPESEFVVDMHIDAVAMSMQRRRRSVLHRVRQWLERLVGRTSAQPWRSALVPVGSFVAIAFAVATSSVRGPESNRIPLVEGSYAVSFNQMPSEAEGSHAVSLTREQVEYRRSYGGPFEWLARDQVYRESWFVGFFDGRAGEVVIVTARSKASSLVVEVVELRSASQEEEWEVKARDRLVKGLLLLATGKYTVRVKVGGDDVDPKKEDVEVTVDRVPVGVL